MNAVLLLLDLRKVHYAFFLFVALVSLAMALWVGVALLQPPPYFGMELLGDGHVHDVDPEGPAFRAGLRENDRVLAVDGMPLHRRAALHTGKSVGDLVTLHVQREGDRFHLTFPLSEVTRGEWIFGLERLLVGVIFWLVGVLVWMLRPASGVTRLFFILGQVVALRTFAESLDPNVPWAMLVSDVLKVLLAAVVLHFYASFPTPLPHRLRMGLLGAAYGGFAVLALLVLTSPLWVTGRAESSALWTTLRAFEIAVFTVALGVLFRPQGTAPIQHRRRRRVLIAGMLLGVFPVVLITLLPTLLVGKPLLPYAWTLPCAALVPLVYAYAVYKGELGQVDLILNRSLVYFLLTALLLSLYALLFFGLDRMLDTGRNWGHLLAGAALVVATSALFVPLRARLQRWVDHLFYGGWYDYRTFVQAVSTELSRTTTLGDLLVKIRTAAQTMRFQAGAFLWPRSYAFAPRGSFGYSRDTLRLLHLPVDGALARYLERSARPCAHSELRRALAAADLTEAERRLMDHPRLEYWVPLVCRDVLRGILVASQHQGDEVLDKDDLAILSTLAAQAAIACENIALLESLRARLKEVEQVRDELAETQGRLADGREEERRHLARELHDGPVQDLYAMGHGLEVLAATVDDPVSARRLASLRDTLQEVAGTLRDICIELRPPLLADFGLETAIRSYAARFQEKHPQIQVHLDLIPDDGTLPERVQLALFRICQEALNNAAQHARAHHVTVCFALDATQMRLSVKDDGCGFAVPDRWIELGRRGHLGLLGIAERAEAIGGALEVDSEPGRGTTLCVTAPRLTAHPPVPAGHPVPTDR